MNYAIHLTPEAEADISEIVDWYDEESFQASDRFEKDLESTLQKIARYPDSYRVVPRKNVRIHRLKRFPYYVFYRDNAHLQQIEVVAVIHTARHPDVWDDRF